MNKELLIKFKAEISNLKSELELSLLKIERLQSEIDDSEWKTVSWEELRQILIKQGHDRKDYAKNPTVRALHTDYTTYCYLSDEEATKGELVIGGYYHNDWFKRGKPVKIKHNLESWR